MGDYDSKRKKRIVVISISSFVLLAIVVAVTVGYVRNHSNPAAAHGGSGSHDVSASMKAIKTICQPTDYKQACIDSLSSAAGNSSDPKDLIQASFKVAMKQVSNAAQRSTVLQELEKDPRAAQALQNCKELMDYAISDLQTSFQQVADFDVTKLGKLVADVKVWLSAAITYQETCLDGFQNTTGSAGENMKKALKTSAELTKNGLAIIDEFESVFTSLQIPSFRRRLLAEDGSDVPEWVDAKRRRLLQASPADLKPNMVVAKDGSGDFKSLKRAIEHIPKKTNTTFVLYIKEGVYNEVVRFNNTLKHLVLIGDGPTKTRITGRQNFVDGTPTFKTATVSVLGDFFMAKNIGFENSAGPEKHQAVALRVQADQSIFYNCHIDGYQDTLYAHAKRQFYRDCRISGTIDFIFGDAAAVFQNCTMVVRKPMENQQCIVTAQGRTDRRQPSALVILNSRFVSDPAYYPVRNQQKSYLGRPWKEFSRTIIINSFIDDLIQPAGWLPWMGDYGLKTCFYTEFKNQGPGSPTGSRVKWQGIKTLTANQAADFAPGKFIDGDSWIAPSGVPYSSGLTMSGSVSEFETVPGAVNAPAPPPA
ncbi:probable pectinesterase/pectinesterase inhibitor 21 [Malania oleifera]|uniref:probable pectinesterase/pectinesterase inhibitor 21 n=1 Tax=Malania oleifera TaxID=397392 RepID=UPI0025AE6409|nr:probable pectinesterase/pectinesterase inhibitor 21 [Malania oleifera]